IIHTNFYSSDRVLELSKNARWLFMYYLTCSGIGLSGAFKWSDSKTLFETALNKVDLQKSKEELEKYGLATFLDSWVIIPGTNEKTGFDKGGKTSKAYEAELDTLPPEVREKLSYPMHRVSDFTIPPEIRNKKSEILKGIVKGESSTGRAAAERLISVFNQATGKNYSPTDKRCKLIADRLKSFPSEQLVKAAENIALSPFHMGKNDRGWSADPDWLFRNDENVDKLLNLEVKEVKKPMRLGFKALTERSHEIAE
ncbi:MAG: hypothetical protein RL642_300, partial [Bacteroidota bacterium]